MEKRWRLTTLLYKSTPSNLFALDAPTKIIKRTAVNLSFKILSDLPMDHEKIPILLFHDILSNKKHWEGIGKTILTLTKRPVIVVDLRNHGDSPHSGSHKYRGLGKDILKLLSKLAVEKASLIGHSMGGMASMSAALIAPEKVAGILIVDISPISTATQMTEYYGKVLNAMKEFDFQSFRKVRKAKKAARKKLKFIINDNVVLQDVLWNVNVLRDGQIGWKCNLDALIKNFKHVTAFPLKTFRGKSYSGPALFVGGQRSEYLPPDDLPGIRDAFPRAVITYLPNCGHSLHVDDPKTFLEFAIAFVRTHE